MPPAGSLVHVKVQKVLLAEPRGFCAGVEMAIKALEWVVRIFEPPVYCYHQIVHNEQVVSRFEQLGVVFVDDLAQVPDGAPLVLSAHGAAPSVVAAARERSGALVNAVCPLVTKVHREIKVRAERGYEILYVGHHGHEEAIGATAVAPDATHLIETEGDLDAVQLSGSPTALVAQTTLSHDEWQHLASKARERFDDLWMPARGDLCFATTNRQAALKAIAGRSDAIIVIGSASSSNTLALEKVARSSGCQLVKRVDSPRELPPELSGIVGVTAGASAPQQLVEEVLTALDPVDGIEEIATTVEDEYFPPPPDLRELLRNLALVTAVSVAAPAGPTNVLEDDRSVPAFIQAGS